MHNIAVVIGPGLMALLQKLSMQLLKSLSLPFSWRGEFNREAL